MLPKSKVRAWYIASEVTGFVKTGGLADVAASLPPALAERGVDLTIVMPFYRAIQQSKLPLERTNFGFSIPIGDNLVHGQLWRTRVPDSNIPVLLIDQPDYFGRDDPAQGAGIYQYMNAKGQRVDYPDNCARFTFFCRAVLEAIKFQGVWPDLLHVNDWQTGMVPVFLKEIYQKSGKHAVREAYQKVRTLLTIHNLAYQGAFWHYDMPILGLPWSTFTADKIECYGKINFLKSGIVYSDLLNTVSPTYAREIQTMYFGVGLDGLLRKRDRQLFGIVNGIDYRAWDPAVDSFLPCRYAPGTLDEGKALCKAELQRTFGLEMAPRRPLIGIVSRLADQKGWDLLAEAAPRLFRNDVQLVVLGDGEPRYHQMLLDWQTRYPRQVGIRLTLDEGLAHRIEAGCDLFLMPSRYEPCGLNQLYSLKYGSLPLVRRTGGLADTVVDATPANLQNGTATGFVFVSHSSDELLETLDRALVFYRDRPTDWRRMQLTGMHQDWSWQRSAAEYEKLYHLAMKTPLGP